MAGLVLALTALLLTACSEEPDGPRVTTLPELSLAVFPGSDVSGLPGAAEAVQDDVTVRLSELKGPMVVNVWATWCGPCRHEMPVIEAFHREFGDEVAVLGIDHKDPQLAAAKKFAEQTGVSYPMLRDPDGLVDRAEPFGHLKVLPYWAFVDASGTVVHQEFRTVDGVGELVELSRTYLGVPGGE